MLPIARNEAKHNVVIYENIAGQALSGQIWTLKRLLHEQLEHNPDNCLKALELTLKPLRLFYISEPGSSHLTDSKGQMTWRDVFPDIFRKLEPFEMKEEREWLKLPSRMLPDPLEHINNFLDEMRGRVMHSRIHGDLNLTNIIVGLNGHFAPDNVFLIDLANSKSDAVTACDLARLECEFWQETFPEISENDLTCEETVNMFVLIRDCIDGRSGILNDSIESMEYNIVNWINEIRKEANQTLSYNMRDYKMADYMTALYFTHLKSLS